MTIWNLVKTILSIAGCLSIWTFDLYHKLNINPSKILWKRGHGNKCRLYYCLLITESFYWAQIACLHCTASKLEGNNYPMFLCAARLCICLHWFVYNMSVYTCIFSKKLAFLGLSTWKLAVRVIYCLLIEFKRAKWAYYTRWFSHAAKEIRPLLTGGEVGSENCISVVTCIRSSSVLDVHAYSAEYYYYDCSYCTTLLQLHHSVLRVCVLLEL